jgi:hypothetical protein
VLSVVGACATAALLGTVGADARWVAALGKAIVGGHGLDEGVPFATAPSADWNNVPVLAELLFHWLTAGGGERALFLAQVAAVAVAFTAVAAAARRDGATDAGLATALALAFLGAVPTLAVARLQLFSLALFPLLLLLLRAEARHPSRRIFVLVPLFALWSNLHGAALVGLAVAGAYLLFERLPRDPLTALGALAGCVVALCATPALLDTPSYYAGVLQNEAAQRGVGLWAHPSLSSGFDVLLIVCSAAMLALALRARPRLWEVVAITGLALGTALTARNGVWLLLFAALPASRAVHSRRRPSARTTGALATALLVTVAFGVVRGPVAAGAPPELIREAVARADGTPILAEDVLAEQVALAGGTIWIGNPIDAFARADQRLYLDWLQGKPSGDAAVGRAGLVLVHRNTPAHRRLEARDDVRDVARDGSVLLYLRVP